MLPSEIAPLTDDTTVAGVAFPGRGRRDLSVDYEQNLRRILRMLGEVPGDVVVGDVDGVVCVPGNVAEEVLERAEEVVGTETEVREAVGMPVTTANRPHKQYDISRSDI